MPSNNIWQRLALSLPVGFGIVSTVLVVIGATRLLPSPPIDPADVLPADQTLMVISNADRSKAEHWAAFFHAPALPQAKEGSVFALLEMDGKSTWIVLQPDTALDPPWNITASDPGSAALLGNLPSRLSGSRAYRSLRSVKRESLSWMWWRAEVSDRSTLIPPSISVQLQAGMLTSSGTSLQIAMLPRTLPRFSSVTAAHTPAGKGFLWLQYPAATLALVADLPTDITLPIQGLILERVRSMFGGDVSLAYDLFPLLAGGSTSLRVDSASGGNIVTLRGIGDRDIEARLSSTFSRAHDFASVALLDRRDIDGFALNEVREDAGAIAEESTEMNGWRAWIRTHRPSGNAVCVARRGNAFLIVNRRDACVRAMETGVSEASTITGTIPLATVRLDASLIAQLRSLRLPGLPGFLMEQAPDGGFEATVEWEGEVVRFVVSSE